MKIEVVDNTNAVEYPGHELVDMSCTPPRTFAIGLPKGYADKAAQAMNNHEKLLTLVKKVQDLLINGDHCNNGRNPWIPGVEAKPLLKEVQQVLKDMGEPLCV